MDLDWLVQSDLLAAGGWVLGCILAASTVMWILILERYWFYVRVRPRLVHELVEQWAEQRSWDPLFNLRLRDGLTGQLHGRMSAWVGTIQVITAVLPLLGLLGTVIGMIKTFEVMTVFGSGNVRGMADGISQALITTMAGLLTGIAGMYFASDLQHRITLETDRLEASLNAELDGDLRTGGNGGDT